VEPTNPVAPTIAMFGCLFIIFFLLKYITTIIHNLPLEVRGNSKYPYLFPPAYGIMSIENCL
jgi:hypothetical protein